MYRTAPSEGRVLFCLALGWLLSSFTIRFSLSCFFFLFFFYFRFLSLSHYFFLSVYLSVSLSLSLSVKCCSSRGERAVRFTSYVTRFYTRSQTFFEFFLRGLAAANLRGISCSTWLRLEATSTRISSFSEKFSYTEIPCRCWLAKVRNKFALSTLGYVRSRRASEKERF